MPTVDREAGAILRLCVEQLGERRVREIAAATRLCNLIDQRKREGRVRVLRSGAAR